MSSSSQAARGSPSRGWPTLPGLISQRPRRTSRLVPAAAWAPRASSTSPPPRAVGEGEEEGDVRVADEAHPLRLGADALAPPGRARARTPRSDRAARRGRGRPRGSRRRARGRRGTRACVVAHRARASSARPPPRRARRSRCRAARARRGRGCRPGRPGSCSCTSAVHSSAGRRSRRRRPGTRSGRRRRSSTSARTASSAGRFEWMSLIRARRIGDPRPAGGGGLS